MALSKKKPSRTAQKTSVKPTTKTKTKTKTKSSSNVSLRDRAKEKLKGSSKRGFTAMRDAKSERREGSQIRGFFVKKGETKSVIILTDDPIIKRVHTHVAVLPNGKTFYPESLCTEDDDCEDCIRAKDGDKSVRAAATTGAMMVLDVEGYKTGDDKEVPWVVRPWSINPTLSSVLEHRDQKEGLMLTMFDVTKLDRGLSLDVVRDDDDDIQRFKSNRELIKYLRTDRHGNKETADILQKALDEHGDFRTWLQDEIIPEWWNPENVDRKQTSSSSSDDDDDEDEPSSRKKYGFRKDKKSGSNRSSTKPEKKRSRFR